MQINSLKPRTKSQNRKRVGRGGAHGKTSGRGHKGQKQHGGHGIRPQVRDEIKRLPKLRGRGVNSNKSIASKVAIVNLGTLEKDFSKGLVVSPKTLQQNGLILKNGKFFPVVKILGRGDVTKKFIIVGCRVSESAKEKIQKAGGKVK